MMVELGIKAKKKRNEIGQKMPYWNDQEEGIITTITLKVAKLANTLYVNFQIIGN
jgi:hypothetical protein